ncbi:C-glycoside deglycosidase beta subunit domain-containing protein [Novosphingobium sp.]|uniref:C-glycoside deglycosidase beta subunit domain-containing protein n=1 Tax=Novosphingobium sp. TaxID=1874826 RepID=UPI003B52262B
MFDKYLLDAASLRNLGPADAPTGFAFEAKLGYYRGLGLSMIEELNVSIDGQACPRESITFDEGHGPITLEAMETAYERRWPFGEVATVAVAHQGGFPAGEHTLTFQQKLRISYLPFPSFNTDEKRVSL